MKKRPPPYTPAQMQWLEANRMMVISDYHSAFCATFHREEVSAAMLQGLRKREGWKVGRAAGRLAGRHRLFTSIETAWLRDNCTMVMSEYHRAFCAEFDREDLSAAQLHGLRKRKGWKTGRTGCFEKGSVSVNKGRPMPYHPNSARTRFRKGELPHNTKFAGHERLSRDGYVQICVDETNPHTGFERRYVLKHRWLWERQNGPVPEGMALKCVDGDKTNTDPSNWEPVPRALLPRLNGRFGRGYDTASADLKPTIMAVTKLEHAARQQRPAKGGAA